MPSIRSRIVSLPDRPAPAPVNPAISRPPFGSTIGREAPGPNPVIRCSFPPLFASTDNLRQYFAGGAVPQYRILPVKPIFTK